MALATGTTLGTYEITGSLGAGGMGEVYRARDSKLGRSVAIKVLPQAFAADPDRVPRFEREAKVLASLNHPHIAALYGMEQAPGQPPTHFLIMELVEGETLYDRLQRGPLAVSEALAIGIQIADALESAHEQGVVHRDLKPANVKITPDEEVKVLDFGLAKAMDSSPAASSPANSPTLSVLATQAGIIMGTAAYMSPEQAKGAAIDRRSDVFSFGVVLYELLTGRQPFRGETAAEVMASVMIREADLTALPDGLHPRIAQLIARCIEKNPKKRWQAMGDLRVELESLAAAPFQMTAPAVIVTREPFWKRAVPVVAVAVVSAVVATFIDRQMAPPPRRDVVRFAVPTPTFIPDFQNIALSPDGMRLVYVVQAGRLRHQLMLRTLGDLEARPLGGADGQVSNPVFSPDGQSVAFYSSLDSTLNRIAVNGGAKVTLGKATAPISGISWGGDWILYGQPNGIQRVSADGGAPEVIVPIEGNQRVSSPQVIDEKGSILFSFQLDPRAGEDQTQVVVQTPDGTRHVVLRGGSDARYFASGHLVYALGPTVFAVPFDAATRRALGSAVAVVEGIARGVTQGRAALYAMSASGTLAYVPAGAIAAAAPHTLALVDPSGKVQRLPVPADSYFHPRVSPDGRLVVMTIFRGNEPAIWVYDLYGSAPPRRLTFDGADLTPIWNPDGRSVTFRSNRAGGQGLFQQRADGTGAAERLTTAEPGTTHHPDSWSPDGKTLSFRVVANSTSSIWTWSREGDRKPHRLLHGEGSYGASEFSPDGRWLAYGTNELDGRTYQVFVQPFPPTRAKYQVSPTRASTPHWSRDGKRLLFGDANQVWGATITVAPAFSASQAVQLDLPNILPSTSDLREYDLMPDGKRLLVVLLEGAGDARQTRQINVVLNWFDELKAKVPVP